MKLLRISAKGLPLFRDGFDVSFVASQRVAEEDKNKLYRLFSNIYLNPTEAFVGINASGKTMTLKLIMLAVDLVKNTPLNHSKLNVYSVLGDVQNAVITVYFFSEKNGEVCRLETTITYDKDRYFIKEESFKIKKASEVKSRKALFDFDVLPDMKKRSDSDREFLLDDVSIVISYNRRSEDSIFVTNTFFFTNLNVFVPNMNFKLATDVGEIPDFGFTSDTGEIPRSLITFLDPTIERLRFENKGNTRIIHLKFFHQKKELVLNEPIVLEFFLSSGTIRGISLFTEAIKTIQQGGIMIVDEIENHFNREIVATLVRFFMDRRVNKKGAVLIFSTHYSELLDEFDRNDCIFITKNQHGITAENLSDILTRNDVKKSEAYQSGFLGGTTPAYEAYVQLRKSFQVDDEGRRA